MHYGNFYQFNQRIIIIISLPFQILVSVIFWRVCFLPNLSWVESSPVIINGFSIIIFNEKKTASISLNSSPNHEYNQKQIMLLFGCRLSGSTRPKLSSSHGGVLSPFGSIAQMAGGFPWWNQQPIVSMTMMSLQAWRHLLFFYLSDELAPSSILVQDTLRRNEYVFNFQTIDPSSTAGHGNDDDVDDDADYNCRDDDHGYAS